MRHITKIKKNKIKTQNASKNNKHLQKTQKKRAPMQIPQRGRPSAERAPGAHANPTERAPPPKTKQKSHPAVCSPLRHEIGQNSQQFSRWSRWRKALQEAIFQFLVPGSLALLVREPAEAARLPLGNLGESWGPGILGAPGIGILLPRRDLWDP